jgi:hypothetical protein
MQTWDLWYPKAAATGLSFARCKIDPVKRLLVHAAPPVLSVTVRDEQGSVVAEGLDLPAQADTPITRLTILDGRVEREEIWPENADLGCIVVLPGGEAGFLKQWWNAADHSEWRWLVEFYNQKGK